MNQTIKVHNVKGVGQLFEMNLFMFMTNLNNPLDLVINRRSIKVDT